MWKCGIVACGHRVSRGYCYNVIFHFPGNIILWPLLLDCGEEHFLLIFAFVRH